MAKTSTDDKINSVTEETGDSSVPFNGTSATDDFLPSDILNQLESKNPNILDSYSNVTYHLKFSFPVGSKEIIIIESGKTDLYIDSFEIDSSIGTNFRVRNIISSSMVLKLREAQGTTLFDKLYFIQNTFSQDFKLSEYRITLSFNGYDSSGNPVTNIGGTYVWSVLLQKIDYKIDTFGTVYNVSLISKINTAFSDDIGVLQQGGAVLPQSGTLRDILSSLKDLLNEQNKNNNNGIQIIKYDFEDVPYSTLGVSIPVSISSPLDMTILNSASQTALQNSSRNDDVSQHAAGTQISKYIDSLMANSLEANGLLLNVANPDCSLLGSPNDATYSITHRVVASITYGEFDPAINNFRKTVTYRIVPRISVNAIQSTRQVNSGTSYFKTWSVKKFQEMYSNGVLNKKYDYIFTGKNTNVFDFDISGNMFYAVNFPSLMGTKSSVSAITEGQTYSPLMYDGIHYDTAFYADEKRLQDFNATTSGMDLTVVNQDSPYEEALKEQEGNVTSNTNYLTIFETDNLKNYLQNTVDSQVESVSTAKRLSNEEKLASYKSNYIDDIFTNTNQNSLLYIPINITSQQNNFSYVSNVEQNIQNTSSIYSTIMNQIYVPGTDCLQELSLKIRYDPYWIGCLPPLEYVGSTVELTYDNDEYNKLDLKDQCLILNFNVPITTSEYDQVTLKKSDAISGVYAIHNVRHVFGEGNMYQVLSGNRLALSPLSDLINASGE